MQSPFNLDIATLDRLAVLVQGVTNSGKTHLCGDMLAYEKQFGPVKFLNVRGEDGASTNADMGLGAIGVNVDHEGDVQDVAADCLKNKVHAVALDGARLLFNQILVRLVQSKPQFAHDVRLPDARLDGDSSKSYWAQARFRMEQTIALLKTSVNVLLVTTTSQKDLNEVTGQTQIAPDIYGKMGAALVGLFDFSGYMTFTIQGPARVQWEVSFQPRTDVQTRQRLAYPITSNIILPDGPGGWKTIKSAFEKGLRKGAK